MVVIREATENDVQKVSDLFVNVYGEDYPFGGFYDTAWLKKSVFGDDTIFLVAEEDGEILATGSVMLDVGGLNDLLGEIGRLVASPSRKAAGAAQKIIEKMLEMIEGKVHFAFGEVRTVHSGSQRLSEKIGWIPVGYEPLKYRFTKRESVVMYANISPLAVELRRNNPRVIPEAALISQDVLSSMGLPVDVIIEDEDEGYPTSREFEVERLNEKGVTSLLRIERGRVTNREIFGNFSLSHGFFRISSSNSYYLVAREGKAVLGAVGFTHDTIDKKVRIFELIEFDDAVKGYLISCVDKIARDELGVEYQEVDVSAYSPKIQRTFERLGFVPVAYCPSMVFDNVERLDVLRMAKLSTRYNTGRMKLLENPARIKAIIEKGLEDHLHGMEITEAEKKTEIFHNLPDGDLHHLARISLMKEFGQGHTLIRKGDIAENIYIIVEGEVEVKDGQKIFGILGEGEIFGEMALMEKTTRSADVVLKTNCKIIEINISQLVRLMDSHPRLGFVVMSNLARGLSQKLRQK